MKILILGASGMLGNAMLRVLSACSEHRVVATARSATVRKFFTAELSANIIPSVDVENMDGLARLFNKVRPDVVINCIGLVKQLDEARDPIQALSINSLLPHRLSRLCELASARLIHVSTDCVFSGRKGSYIETDTPDAEDLYGRSKLLGEVDYPHAITLRTSIIGHELNTAHGLIDWFLAQKNGIKGYTRAIFSGLPTCELANVVRDHVISRPNMCGVYQVSAEPISKFELLKLINQQYGANLSIAPDDAIEINRSLDGSRFREVTGYVAPAWPDLVAEMHSFQLRIR